MGADGHIAIYDLEILEAILGKGNINYSANVYIHQIFGKNVVTKYWGDNLWSYTCMVCGQDHCEDPEHITRIKPAHITSWEIWT